MNSAHVLTLGYSTNPDIKSHGHVSRDLMPRVELWVTWSYLAFRFTLVKVIMLNVEQ